MGCGSSTASKADNQAAPAPAPAPAPEAQKVAQENPANPPAPAQPIKQAPASTPAPTQPAPAAAPPQPAEGGGAPRESSKALAVKLEETFLAELVKKTHFDRNGVEHLYEIFKVISSSGDDDGLIDIQEFKEALNLKDTLWTDRIFRLFDDNDDKGINFDEFITGLSNFCKNAPAEEKIEFSFKVYDLDMDGYISREELLTMVDATIKEQSLSISEQQKEELLTSTFQEAGAEDGRMTLQQYKALVAKHPSMLNHMTISSLKTFGS